MKNFKTILAFIIFLGLAIGSAGNDGTEKYDQAVEESFSSIEETTPQTLEDFEALVEFEVTSFDMTKLYQENEILGDATYKGKWVKISGKVQDVGKKDTFDENFNEYTYLNVSLAGSIYSDFQNKWIESDLNVANVSFTLDEVDKLIRIKAGDYVTIIGFMEGVDMFEDPEITGYYVYD